MKAKTLRSVVHVLGLALALAAPVRAQEDVVPVEPAEEPAEEPATPETKPPAERPETRFFLEFEYLEARTVGGDLRIGTERDEAGTFLRSLYLPEDSSSGARYRGGWKLPEDWGELVAVYWSHEAKSQVVVSRPGEFVFGITETIPFAHGVADDGFADAISGSATFRTRDGQLAWRFPALDRPHVRLGISTGIRHVTHRQDSALSYHALDPGLPPLIGPDGEDATFLAPIPDRVYTLSEFSGRGLQLGFDATVPIVGDRLQLEASASFAILRGTTRASYGTLTSAYFRSTAGGGEFITLEELIELLESGNYSDTTQTSFVLALDSPGRSTTASALDASLGLRSRVWRGIELAVGIRMSRYDDVVYDLRPTEPAMNPSGFLTFGGVDERWRSIGSEAFYAAAAYRF